MSDANKVRVRIAPSPTGVLHIGTARTALFNWLFAKKHEGAFILRIEDTDRERSKPEFERDIVEHLAWLGLTHNEFARQSERTKLYKEALEKLLSSNKAFFCGHSTEELEREQEAQKHAKEPPRHICADRDLGKTLGIIRLKNDFQEPIVVSDLIRGDVTYDPQLFGDFSLAKNVDEPLYNFAAVVDDADMKISHVIRGEDHLPNTPKQIMVGRLLGLTEPEWAHLPLLLGPDRSKLSKRHGALGVGEYKKMGYLPEALLNFLALLGWHPKDEAGEIFALENLVREFSLERIQKGGAVADIKKLDWFNREHMKRLAPNVLCKIMEEFSETLKALPRKELYCKAVAPRLTRLSDAEDAIRALVRPPEYTKELLLRKGKIEQEKVSSVLRATIKRLESAQPEDFESALSDLIEKEGKGTVLWPLRSALSGSETSPGPFEIASAIGKEETLKRLNHALKIIQK